MRLNDLRQRATKLIAYENQNASFQRRIDRYQTMLDGYDNQLERADVSGLDSGLHVRVLRPAGLGFLVGPSLPKALVLGAMIGLALGGGLGYLLDWSERTFRNPDEIASVLNVPILTHLPVMAIGRRGRRKKNAADDPYVDIDPVVTVLHERHSAGAEAFRSVRTSLVPTGASRPEFQVMQITSPLPGDGKSTIVTNLAASMALAKKRVLIIDADLRRPTQSKVLGVESEVGLTDFLNGEVSFEDAIQPTAAEGLYVMPSGPKPDNPAEAFMLDEFGQLIDEARLHFDVVLVDTPPLLSVTDASNIARQVDGVMLVMRIGRNIKPMSKRAIMMLRLLHVNIIGVVVNAIGDSGYSASYAQAWSNSYGGQPGSEYSYGYYKYGSDRYLNASKGQGVTVRGRSGGTDPTTRNGSAAAPNPLAPVGPPEDIDGRG